MLMFQLLRNSIRKIESVELSWNKKDIGDVKRKVFEIISDIDDVAKSQSFPDKVCIHILEEVSGALLNIVGIMGRSVQITGSQVNMISNSDESDRFSLPSTNKLEVRFDDIIGNVEAKRALFESIVLRFSLNPKLKRTLFVGPRKLSNNILLYGPPGCGTSFPYSECKQRYLRLFCRENSSRSGNLNDFPIACFF
jgi:ATP-dependent 26S proteasome regulatory subunit